MNTGVLRTNSTTRSLKFLFITTILVSTLLLSAIYVSNDPANTPSSEASSPWVLDALKRWRPSIFFRSPARKPLVLVWTTYFSQKSWLPQFDHIGCSASCEISFNRDLMNQSDAVMFHLRDVNPSDLPDRSSYNQVWVLYNLEAPPHTPADQITALKSKINWTVSYRRDSDIYHPYGQIVERRDQAGIPEIAKVSGVNREKSFVCWIVSNCVTPSHRETYVEELQRYIPVIIYGKCGKRSCPTSNVYDCYKELSKNCKFYLSFENSICTDYATEKVYFALRSGMVPVVMGGEDYSKALPNNSYINAADFDSPKDLAAFLWQLGQNQKKYASYHQWRNYYEVKNHTYMWMCGLCEKLHNLNPEKERTPANWKLDSWWFGNASCFTWQEYFDLRGLLH